MLESITLCASRALESVVRRILASICRQQVSEMKGRNRDRGVGGGRAGGTYDRADAHSNRNMEHIILSYTVTSVSSSGPHQPKKTKLK